MNMNIVDRHQSPVTWATQTHNRHPSLQALLHSSSPAPIGSGASTPNIAAVTSNTQTRHYYSSPYAPATRPPSTSGYEAPIPPKNERELTRDALKSVLDYFSQLVPQHFGDNRPIRLVVHGGACMLLHEGLYKLSLQQHQMSPHLPRRTTTRDVDYIHRSFVSEMTSLRVPDAALKLAECVKGTARRFGLGLDWMNSDADVALPYAYDPQGKPYDPIYHASIQPNNIELHTIYTSTNKMLTLISVTPFWAVSLKLVRYVKWDPGDICLLLRNGVVLSGVNWTPDELESWLYTNCWAMGYAHFDAVKKQQMRDRILDAINQLQKWNEAVGVIDDSTRSRGGRRDRDSDRERSSSDKEREAMYSTWLSTTAAGGGRTLSAHDAMGGGEVIGGGGDSATNSGWTWGWVGGKSWPSGKKRSALNLNGKEREKDKEGILLAKSPPPPNMPVPAIPGPGNPSGGWGSPWATPAGLGQGTNGNQRAMHVRDWAEGGGGYKSSGSGSGSDKDRRRQEKEQQARSKSRSGGRRSGEDDFTAPVPFVPDDTTGQRRSSGEERYRDRGRASGRSPSRARRASPSQVRSRSRSVGGIFVPDSDEEDDQGYAPTYPPPARQSSTQPYQSQPQAWIHVNPNHAPNPKPIRQQSPEPPRQVYSGIYAPPVPTDSRAAMRSPVGASGRQSIQPVVFDHDPQYGFGFGGHTGRQQQRTHHTQVSYQGHTTPANGRHSPMPDASARYAQTEKTRKKKEKERRRTKSIVRARERKWAPRIGDASETDDSDAEVDSGMESDSGIGESESEDEQDRGRKGSGVKGWGSAMMGWARGSKRDQRAPQNAATSLAPPSRSVQPLASHPGSRLASRNPSPNPNSDVRSRSASRRRPTPLDISPPPPVPPQLSNGSSQGSRRVSQPVVQQPNVYGHGHNIMSGPSTNESLTSNLNPSELAQYQFEQQQKEYQRQLAVQGQQPTVKQVAQHVAARVQAQSQEIQQQQGGVPSYHQAHSQHPHSWYGQQPQQTPHQQPHAHALRGHASWAAPSAGPSSWGQPAQHQPPQQSYYHHHQQQQQHQPQRQARGLRPSNTEVFR